MKLDPCQRAYRYAHAISISPCDSIYDLRIMRISGKSATARHPLKDSVSTPAKSGTSPSRRTAHAQHVLGNLPCYLWRSASREAIRVH